jgi:hypothetical protein
MLTTSNGATGGGGGGRGGGGSGGGTGGVVELEQALLVVLDHRAVGAHRAPEEHRRRYLDERVEQLRATLGRQRANARAVATAETRRALAVDHAQRHVVGVTDKRHARHK